MRPMSASNIYEPSNNGARILQERYLNLIFSSFILKSEFIYKIILCLYYADINSNSGNNYSKLVLELNHF